MSSFDVLIIGSGLGGLECAYILSKEGYKVCVLEKNRQLGGSLQIFVRDKTIFDTGVHYIGGLDEGQNLNRYFRYFGIMDDLKLRKMDESGFDRITFDDHETEYKHAMGYEGFVEELVRQFPKERAGIEKYTQMLRDICHAFPLYELRQAPPNHQPNFVYADVSAKAFIESCTNNIRLQNVLAGSNPLYAGYPDETPLYVHALVVNTYIESAWKCIDGGAQIARLLAKRIKANGGTILNYHEAKKFIFEGKKIRAVELKDGRQIEAKHFISNIHPAATMQMIEQGKIRNVYKKRIQSLDNSLSAFTVHIVFKENSFPYLNHNYYHHKSPDVWQSVNYKAENWPEGYALFVPASSKSEEFADSMNVITYMHFEEVAQWSDTFNTIPKHISSRGQSYDEFKIEKAEKLIDELAKKFPNIRSKIKSYHTSTPLSFRDYIGNSDGSLYGIRKDYKNPLKTFMSARTKVPNLYFTGQNLNLHGVLGVTISSVVTCSQLVDQEYLVKKILNA